LAVGDVAFQKKCMGKMSNIAREGRTVLFVSHNIAAINELTQRAILLESGRTKTIGPTNEVTQMYLTAFDNVGSGYVDLRDMARVEKPILKSIRTVRENLQTASVAMGESLEFHVTLDRKSTR